MCGCGSAAAAAAAAAARGQAAGILAKSHKVKKKLEKNSINYFIDVKIEFFSICFGIFLCGGLELFFKIV